MPYYLGIDGGGSKTTCAVGDDTSLVATATAGPSNIVRVGETRARESLHQAVRQACQAAGITPRQVGRTCIGAAGAGRQEIAGLIRKILAEILYGESPEQIIPGQVDPEQIQVVGDTEIALEAAFGSGPGVIVIAGTGSIAYGRDAQGRTARAGGWGFAISDEGSAHWIGREATAAVLRNSDRTYGTAEKVLHANLVTALCQAWAVTSLADLARAANSVPPPDFAALFPAVAASQDVLALNVLSRAGLELAQIASAVTRRLFSGDDAPSVPVAMVGGVFRHSVLTKGDFYNELRRLDPRVDIHPLVVEPVHGALQMARRAAS